jgi:YfiH family protein
MRLSDTFILHKGFSNPEISFGTTVKGKDLNFALHTSENDREREIASQNRANLLKKLNFTGLITLNQTHSDKIHFIRSGNQKTYLKNPLTEGDGLLTDLKGILLGVLTADCVPIYYAHKDFCAIVHAGWKGIKNKIFLQMIEQIRSAFHVHLNEIEIYIGPHIRSCCYEVGKDVLKEFNTPVFEKRNQSIYLNMEAMIKEELIESGIFPGNIKNIFMCSKCSINPSFFSYRNGNQKERMLSFVGRAA